MKLEHVPYETVNKLYRLTKLHETLDTFMNMTDRAVKCILAPGEYISIRSAQCSYQSSIRRYKYPIKARILNGELYLIKVDG